ncbi:MAG TPA: FlgD immunoglobulin-like domain containing protein, partial [Candidatus Goldiibacteriota bacterium]|nr:FlgD immunoglobulin-like domain containing protein [Candidatus Goldiibacteriota bacterium]
MRTTELIQKEITSFSFDWNAVNDPGVFHAEKNRLRFGLEQWLLDNHFALRGGLAYFMYPGPWRLSVGLSARYWLGIDYAYCTGLPFGEKAEEESDSHWLSVYWMWGKVKRKLPTPEVSAAVDPISFAPRNGEVVTFKLNATSEAGIDRWVLNILDKNNNLVKSYVDIGLPPSQIIWNGTDNKYQLLPDGEYIFVFEATDKLGSTSSTPVQSVKIYTPVLPSVNKEALNQLKALLNRLKDRDLREDNAEAALAKSDIEKLKKEKAKPTPVPPPGPETLPGYGTTAVLPGILPQQVTSSAGTGPVSVIGFPNVESGAIRSAYLETRQDGTKLFNVDYVTENTIPKYVLKEMALMVRTVAESFAENSAYSISQVGINALLGGGSSMSLIVPVATAQN